DAEKMAFLDSLVSPKGLFVPAMDGFAERFSEAQKALQEGCRQKAPITQPAKPAKRHLYPKLSFAKLKPFPSWLMAWAAILGMPSWVLNMTKRGYSLQFTRRPPCFRGIIQTLVPDNDAHVLRHEVQKLLANGAVETVPSANSASGFFSHYFLIPKKDGELRPFLDLRHLNRSLMRQPFRMLTLKQILLQ
ncbi:hypothetical protein M9458_010361, partial [Cirrhinus mrigala]